MMQIKGSSHEGQWGSWHVGEQMNLPAGPILSFVVDGDELRFLLDALDKAGVLVNYNAEFLTPVL